MIQDGYGWRATFKREDSATISSNDVNTPVAHEGDRNEGELDTLLSARVTDKVCPTSAVALSSGSELQVTPNQGYRAATASR